VGQELAQLVSAFFSLDSTVSRQRIFVATHSLM
jgi:hypothetical protein